MPEPLNDSNLAKITANVTITVALMVMRSCPHSK